MARRFPPGCLQNVYGGKDVVTMTYHQSMGRRPVYRVSPKDIETAKHHLKRMLNEIEYRVKELKKLGFEL